MEFPLCSFCAVGGGDGEGEGGRRQEVFDRSFEGMDFVVTEADAVDDGFGAKAGDFEDVLEGGLGVSVAECIVGGRGGVPLFWERSGIDEFYWFFWRRDNQLA